MSEANAVDMNRLVRLKEEWESRIRDTSKRAASGGTEYVGGLLDAYCNCLRELDDIIESNAEDRRERSELS